MVYHNRQANALLFSCIILVSGLMAIDFINPSLPYIMKSFHASEYSTKQLIVWFFFGICLSQFFYGSLSDNYGRKITIVGALFLACIGILISSYATSLDMMYLGRFINGLGSGGAPVIARAIIADVFINQQSLKKAFSYYSMAGQISPAIVPVVGASIQQYYNWRFMYLALFILNAIALTVILIKFVETRTIPKTKVGYLRQIKIYLDIFKMGRFVAFSFASVFIMFINFAYFSYLPFVFHKLHYLPLSYALLYCVYALSLSVGSLILIKKLKHVPMDKLYIYCLGTSLSAVMLFMVLFSILGDKIYLIIAMTVTFAFINGILLPLTNACCLSFAHKNKGSTSAALSFIRSTFLGLCFFVFNFIFIKNMTSILICILIATLLVCICFILSGSTLSREQSN
jgi:DHA1 family bicyclomycin/chloramphenicol resistance-like MFS transporter